MKQVKAPSGQWLERAEFRFLKLRSILHRNLKNHRLRVIRQLSERLSSVEVLEVFTALTKRKMI